MSPAAEDTRSSAAGPASLKLALGGDTMLGRGVGEALRTGGRPLLDAEVLAVAREADLFLVNLECCISERGVRWAVPDKVFFFRAPPAAADELARWGVSAVTLANNHALDFGPDALLDTLEHLDRVGIRRAGGGMDIAAARAPAYVEARGLRVALVSATDHPRSYAAADDRPGLAFADLRAGDPGWLPHALRDAGRAADVVLLGVHWGRNWTAWPQPHVRAAARALAPLASLVWGHSAHTPHGARSNVLFDNGDFVTDFCAPNRPRVLVRLLRSSGEELAGLRADAARTARRRAGKELGELVRSAARRVKRMRRRLAFTLLRADLGFLFLVTLDRSGPRRLEAVPLKIEFCHTRLARGREAASLELRFRAECRRLGTPVTKEGGRLVAELRGGRG